MGYKMYEIKAHDWDDLGYFWALNAEHAWEEFYRFHDWHQGAGTEFCYIGNGILHVDEFYVVQRNALFPLDEIVVDPDTTIVSFRTANMDDDIDSLFIFPLLDNPLPKAFQYIVVDYWDTWLQAINKRGIFSSLLKAQVCSDNMIAKRHVMQTSKRARVTV